MHALGQSVTVLLSEGTLSASPLEVQMLGGHIVHGRLQVCGAGMEGIRGQSRASHSSAMFQKFPAGGAPGAHSEHVGQVRWGSRGDRQAVDVSTWDGHQDTGSTKPEANLGPGVDHVGVRVGQASLDESLVESCRGHGSEGRFGQEFLGHPQEASTGLGELQSRRCPQCRSREGLGS